MKRNWRSHYITLVANLLVVIATAINFAVAPLALHDSSGSTSIYIILAAPFIASIISSFLYYLDIKYFFADYPYKKFHFRKKWTKFYILGISLFGIEIIAILIFVIVGSFNYLNALNVLPQDLKILDNATRLLTALLWVAFGFSCIFGLIALGFIKYARFKIDVEILARKNGKSINDNQGEISKKLADERAVIIDLDDTDSKTPPVDKSKKDSSQDAPSAGLSSI